MKISQMLLMDRELDRAYVRMVMAGVFNRDIGSEDTEIAYVEAVVVLASKLLEYAGFCGGHIQTIFRLLHGCIELQLSNTERSAPVVLSISDNRYVMVIGSYGPIYDYVEGVRVKEAPIPLLQMSINLTKLLQIARQDSSDSRVAEVATAAADKVEPSAP